MNKDFAIALARSLLCLATTLVVIAVLSFTVPEILHFIGCFAVGWYTPWLIHRVWPLR